MAKNNQTKKPRKTETKNQATITGIEPMTTTASNKSAGKKA